MILWSMPHAQLLVGEFEGGFFKHGAIWRLATSGDNGEFSIAMDNFYFRFGSFTPADDHSTSGEYVIVPDADAITVQRSSDGAGDTYEVTKTKADGEARVMVVEHQDVLPLSGLKLGKFGEDFGFIMRDGGVVGAREKMAALVRSRKDENDLTGDLTKFTGGHELYTLLLEAGAFFRDGEDDAKTFSGKILANLSAL